MTEATRLALQRDGADLQPRGQRVLRGKAEPTSLYAVAARSATGQRSP